MTGKEGWVNAKWRPAMGWLYFVVCLADFIIFPILWSILQAYYKGSVTTAWTPLTLQGGGLFHLAMGAVLGIAAWSRGQEKILGFRRSDTYYNDQQGQLKRPVQQPDEVL